MRAKYAVPCENNYPKAALLESEGRKKNQKIGLISNFQECRPTVGELSVQFQKKNPRPKSLSVCSLSALAASVWFPAAPVFSPSPNSFALS